MAEFLTTSDIISSLSKIIRDARQKVCLISPFLQFSTELYERLKDADRKGIQIIIVFGKKKLEPEQEKKLSDLKNLRLYFYQELHAKCYYNEKILVLTSMNFYEFSQKNREMGILLAAASDKELYSNAVSESESIIANSQEITLNPSIPKQSEPSKSDPGFCIRCLNKIPYNPDKPFCYNCYLIWDDYGNPDYREVACHSCGEKGHLISFQVPQCYRCYMEYTNKLSL